VVKGKTPGIVEGRNMSVQILHVVGARPNFMKAASVVRALAEREGVGQMLVHPGQRYDVSMSDVFFQELGLPEPDVNLEVGSGSHARQTAEIMMRLEPVIVETKPEPCKCRGSSSVAHDC